MTVPESARVVVIGAGIVGNSLVHHLARLGWRDIVQVDQGPLPNPGGSTGHASNFIFPVDHSREITDLTLDSVRQYQELGVFTECGGYELARTPERMEELRRRMSSARAWGIEAELVTPEQVRERVPFLETDDIVGAFWTPSVGVVDSLRAGTLMREAAMQAGALTVTPNVEVTGIDVVDGAVRGVRTDRGDIACETVVVACGVWSPKIAAMAGASIPLTPAVHQMISVGPIPQLAEREGEISFPIVRDMDSLCYERQHGADMEVGSYAHRAILHDPEEIPSIERAKLSPTEMPFTADDFDPQLETALELMPEALGADGAEIRYAINGLLSLTPDGAPVLGETPEVSGLWSAAAVWIKEGPGVGRALAEWMTHGFPEIDLHHSDIARFHAHQRTREHVRARTSEAFIKTYGIVHPGEQWESDRRKRLAPMHAQQLEQGAQFFEAVGWERPQWYAANESLLGDYGDAVMPRENEWDSRWWSPIINAEHLAMRERAGIVDLSAFTVFDVVGPQALDVVQRTTVAQVDVEPGRVVYTPVLDARGGFRSDLTVMRLAHDRFRVVTGGAHGMADRKWFADHARGHAAAVVDLTSAYTTIGLWGPRARDVLGELTVSDISHEGFPFARCRDVTIGTFDVLASRISYVGELGWELYVPMEQGAALWRMLHEAGGRHGAVPVGIGVYATTGRLEKSYRAFGFELDSERTIVEAGMQRPKVKSADFTGREAYLKQRGQEPGRVMCTLAVDDHTSASGVRRYMLGGEPILAADGGTLTDGHGHHPYVTSAGSAPSLGRHLLMAYLPPEEATVGNRLAVSYMEELYPVSVVSADATPAFDPGTSGSADSPHRMLTSPRNERGPRMTRVLVAVKRVVDSSGEAVLTEDQQGLDGRYAGYAIGAHDACAVELAIQVAEATGGSATIVSVGVAEAVEQIRAALALGAHAGVLVEADPVALGPADVAAELAAVVTDAETAGTPYDLVLLGNDAADTGDFQVPVRLAYAVGRPVVTGAGTAEVRDGTLVATVSGPYGDETYEVPLPAVMSVLEGGTEPRYPTLKGRMAAKKIEVEVRKASGEGAGGGRVRWHLPEEPPTSSQVIGEGPQAAPAVVDLLQKLGVLR